MKTEIYSSKTTTGINYKIVEEITEASEDWIAQQVGGEQKPSVSYNVIVEVDGKAVRIDCPLSATKALYKTAEARIERYFAN